MKQHHHHHLCIFYQFCVWLDDKFVFLGIAAKNADKVNFGKRLETKFIQSNEFAVACVKNPELLRTAKVSGLFYAGPHF